MITKNYIAKGEGANRFEKVPVRIYEKPSEAVKAVAREIADLIRTNADKSEKCVLGLATGSSPIKLYEELVRMHREEGLSFKNVVSFNLDEYLPMPKESEQSYHYFMHHHLFDHIDIDPKNIHIPDGTLKAEEIEIFCKEYERQIEAAGGIDIQVLGIGRTGHIGFNEPGSPLTSKTRMVYLDDLTIKDAAGDFGGMENVPSRAITMGVGTIMKARKVILLAWGEKKASIIKATVEGSVSDAVPATFLQVHPNVQFVIDESAAEELTRANQPWLVSKVQWNDKLIRKAVIWLCQKVICDALEVTFREVDISKAVLQHFEDIGHDYNDHSVVFENGQARERTKVLMNIANQVSGMVVGTGDLSELALGWATYNGDHMSMYGVNASIPKTLVRHIVQYYGDTCTSDTLRNVLYDILDTPVSPELLPTDESGTEMTQKTEDLVGPYELHDFFLYYGIRWGFEPSKVKRLAKYAFEGDYPDEVIDKWLKTFYRRFFSQQFKRSCLPDGAKIGSVTLSPRGDWRMPSDAVAKLWLEDIDK